MLWTATMRNEMDRDEASKQIKQMIKDARTDGIVTGLEMADKFMSLTKDRKEVASMIKAAIAAARNR
jgi:hypothetical protein